MVPRNKSGSNGQRSRKNPGSPSLRPAGASRWRKGARKQFPLASGTTLLVEQCERQPSCKHSYGGGPSSISGIRRTFHRDIRLRRTTSTGRRSLCEAEGVFRREG